MVELSSMQDKFQLKKEVDLRILEAKRYSETVHVYAIINKFLIETPSLGLLVSTDVNYLRESDNKEFEIDLMIKDATRNEFLLLEFKTSVREEDNEDTIKNLKEKDDNFYRNGSKFIVNHLCLICHKDNAKSLYSTFLQLNSELNFKRPVSFLIWSIYRDTGNKEQYLIEFFNGNDKDNKFVAYLKDSPLKNDIDYIMIYADMKNFYFTNKKPPIQFLLAVIKKIITQLFLKPILSRPEHRTELKFPRDSLIDDMLIKLSNSLVKPKRYWIIESLSQFQRFGWLRNGLGLWMVKGIRTG